MHVNHVPEGCKVIPNILYGMQASTSTAYFVVPQKSKWYCHDI